MKYYIIINNRKHQSVSSPINGVLAEEYRKEDPFPAMKYDWTKPRDFNRQYPSNLFFIIKGETKFELDYANYWDGFIISQKFKDIIDKSNCPAYKCAKLTIVNTKGEDISNSRNYYFIEMRNSVIDAIDYNNSQFLLDSDMIKMRGLTISEVEKSGAYFGNIKEYQKLSLLSKEIEFDIFQLKDIVIHDLVCNENIKAILEELNSIKFLSTEDAYEYSNRFRD